MNSTYMYCSYLNYGQEEKNGGYLHNLCQGSLYFSFSIFTNRSSMLCAVLIQLTLNEITTYYEMY